MKTNRYTASEDAGRIYMSNSSVESELKAGAAGYRKLPSGKFQYVKSDKQIQKELAEKVAHLDKLLRDLGLKVSF